MATAVEGISVTGRLILAGYGGVSPRALFDSLALFGPDLAVDIRYNPWSPNPAFQSARYLAHLREDAGIPDALHRHDLGNRAYKMGGMDVPESGIAWLADQLADGQNVVIIFACHESVRCHRLHVAQRVAERLPSLVVVEL